MIVDLASLSYAYYRQKRSLQKLDIKDSSWLLNNIFFGRNPDRTEEVLAYIREELSEEDLSKFMGMKE